MKAKENRHAELVSASHGILKQVQDDKIVFEKEELDVMRLFQPLFSQDLTTVHSMEILGTAALGPLMYLLVQSVEDSLRLLGWRPRTEPMPFQPFGE